MLWRLNHELFPDPGRPTASTTIPFEGCCAAGAGGVGVVLGTGRAGPDSVVGGCCCGEVCCPGRFLPRPPRRRRRGRRIWSEGAVDVPELSRDSAASTGSRFESGPASATRDSAVSSRGWVRGLGSGSAAKYAGCSGAGPVAAACSDFLRRFSLSCIHLRMSGLVTYWIAGEQSVDGSSDLKFCAVVRF